MRIGIGADHRGREAANQVEMLLRSLEHQVVDLGVTKSWPCDYPDMAWPVARAVADKAVDCGILIDGTGIGMCIAANKVKGVRAALIHDEIGADMSRRQMDANVMCLPADMLGNRIIERIVETWLKTDFEGGRHTRRVNKIRLMEEGVDPATVGDSEAALD
jgi:ribose 5-phosphate isomerase B